MQPVPASPPVGGAVLPVRTWEHADTFLYDGTVRDDPYQTD